MQPVFRVSRFSLSTLKLEIMSLNGKLIRGVLLDITGVLIEGSTAIQGSVEAVKRLKEANIEVRFVTNETQKTRREICEKLRGFGFGLQEEQIFPPALAMAARIKLDKLKPFLLVHPNCKPDLDCNERGLQDYDSVIIGDAVHDFTYANLNKAFKILIQGAKLFSLGKGKFYRDDGELTLDVGPFCAALEFASDLEAEIVGKPSQDFFKTALQDMKVEAFEAVMVGDDIVSDVGGAQRCQIQGVQVRTGKFRPSDENHPKVKPDLIVDNLFEFVNKLLTAK